MVVRKHWDGSMKSMEQKNVSKKVLRFLPTLLSLIARNADKHWWFGSVGKLFFAYTCCHLPTLAVTIVHSVFSNDFGGFLYILASWFEKR